jgi:SAM-dependent methyltransferase
MQRADSHFAELLALRWHEFVDCVERTKTMAPFLLPWIEKKTARALIDLAAGSGCEARLLSGTQVNLVCNEIDATLRESAQSILGFRPNTTWTACDWRSLTTCFPSDSFDMSLLLGNSLCLILDRAERESVVSEVRDITNNDGLVIVDERNFRYILNERDGILRNGFRYSGKVVYCGRDIHGIPTIIEDETVRFEYKTKTQILGHLDMYPFKEGELVRLFEKNSFQLLEELFDLGLSNSREADFITYVFAKR